MERTPEHPTFLDGAAADLGGPRTMAFLDKCERLIPWDELARSVADVFSRPAKGEVSRGGRPHWPVRLYVKCLMLQKWFNLSDPQLEEQLRDRISFRRFVWYDWLLLGELNGSNVVLKKYAWGPDLSGQSGGGPVSDRSSFAGLLSPVFAHRSGSAGAGVSPVESAGGIGGLLGCLDTRGTGTTADDAAYAFFYDANGNVGQLADLSADPNDPAGALAAAYEYDAYGNVIATTGDSADNNPFRFSTKYWDDEAGLGYWGERYYEPRRGRWVSREPIGADGS